MKELPIVFNTLMVQALLDGRKTMDRRMQGLGKINDDPNAFYFQSLVLHASGKFTFCKKDNSNPQEEDVIECKPRYHTGDLLWVKEDFCEPCLFDGFEQDYYYKCDFNPSSAINRNASIDWILSIFMPKKAARIWLKITDVRVERLVDISEADATAEGIRVGMSLYPAINFFLVLWEKLYGKKSVYANPFVFVYSFEIISTNGKPQNL